MTAVRAHGSSAKPRVLILALNGLEMDRRVENEARLLSSRGFDVTRVGIVAHEGQSESEETDCGRIVRMRPAWHKPAPPRQQVGAAELVRAAHESSRPLVRQWKPKVWVMTRARAYWSPIKKSNARLRTWTRWNDEYFAVCRDLHPDAVIACDLDTLDAGVRLKKESDCVLVYDMHELWAEQRSHDFLMPYHKWLMRLRETRLLKLADMVTTVSKRFAADITKRAPAVRPLVVYSGTDSCNVGTPFDGKRLRVYFQGSFTADRGLEDIIGAMANVREKASLTLQGFGHLEHDLRALAAGLGLAEDVVRFVPPCSPSDVGESARNYDAGVVAGRLESVNARLTTPNRPFAYAAGGLAIVTPANLEEVAEMVGEYDCGVVVDEADPESLAEALSYLADHPDVLSRMKANARKACHAFLWERQFGPVADYLSDTLRSKGLAVSQPAQSPGVGE